MICPGPLLFFFFFFNDTATTEIYTLSLHDALPISTHHRSTTHSTTTPHHTQCTSSPWVWCGVVVLRVRSEEHTSELQSLTNLVCRLLLEKKKKRYRIYSHATHKA